MKPKLVIDTEPILLDCPFCGSKAKLIAMFENHFRIKCVNKNCFIAAIHWYLSRNAAIKMWNTRKPKQSILEAWANKRPERF